MGFNKLNPVYIQLRVLAYWAGQGAVKTIGIQGLNGTGVLVMVSKSAGKVNSCFLLAHIMFKITQCYKN